MSTADINDDDDFAFEERTAAAILMLMLASIVQYRLVRAPRAQPIKDSNERLKRRKDDDAMASENLSFRALIKWNGMKWPKSM